MYPIARSTCVGLLAGALILTACGAGNGATPTPDAGSQLTAVASTVQAELTKAAVLTPSATFTTIPTDTVAAPPTAEIPTMPIGTLPVGTTVPVEGATAAIPATPAVPVATVPQASIPDKALYVSQSIADKTKLSAGDKFTIAWKIKNTGTTTWSTKYQIRHYAGESFNADASVAFPKEVKPGDEVDLSVKMVVPSSSGSHNTVWVLTNADGANFYTVDLTIQVGGSDATKTPKPTKTPTTEPTS
jgi:hypothetical protein